MRIHLIGVCGTGMGALAGLLVSAGHEVSGSDRAFHPPMGPLLETWGVTTMPGWDAANITARAEALDMVVVGNVCRRDNPEAVAALAAQVRRGDALRVMSFPGVMGSEILASRPGYVVAGTHGKTTTTSLLTHLLQQCGVRPGFLVGGVPRGFSRASGLGGEGTPFVIEGDEYDSAFFEKSPKFWQYKPKVGILTSVEHDHIDIYPDEASYLDAFIGFVERIPADGRLIAWAGSAAVREIAKRASCPVTYYAVQGDDCGDVSPEWTAALSAPEGGAQPFDLFGGGSFLSRVYSPLAGAHNARNALAAIAAAVLGPEDGPAAHRASLAAAVEALPLFGGIRRRQELLGVAGGIYVYDDFAHHPTAVRETLKALRSRHRDGRLIAVFEPRSATASRGLHQAQYPGAFRSADVSILAPVGRKEIPEAERLDVAAIADAIGQRGKSALAPNDLTGVVDAVVEEAAPGDVVVIMSNGTFGGVYDDVLVRLAMSQRREPGLG